VAKLGKRHLASAKLAEQAAAGAANHRMILLFPEICESGLKSASHALTLHIQ
jgi:hypothetical protein